MVSEWQPAYPMQKIIQTVHILQLDTVVTDSLPRRSVVRPFQPYFPITQPGSSTVTPLYQQRRYSCLPLDCLEVHQLIFRSSSGFGTFSSRYFLFLSQLKILFTNTSIRNSNIPINTYVCNYFNIFLLADRIQAIKAM